MKGIFINEDGVKYAELIVSGRKIIETRTRNMLKPVVGERVAIISTSRGRKPLVIGYANIQNYSFCPITLLDGWRDLTLIPKGDTYDKLGKRNGRQGKWFYEMFRPERCNPYPLPENVIRHGRSWCEW